MPSKHRILPKNQAVKRRPGTDAARTLGRPTGPAPKLNLTKRPGTDAGRILAKPGSPATDGGIKGRIKPKKI